MTALFNRQGVERKSNGKTEKGAPVYRFEQKCSRCGGFGGSDKWGPHGTNTGWTCWRCGGSGTDPKLAEEKLYTAEKNAVLDAAQNKRDAKKKAESDERARIEAERVVRERDDITARYADKVKRIRAAVPVKYRDGDEYGDDAIDPLDDHEGFLPSIYRQITKQFRALSEGQEEALERTLAKIEAEKTRVAAANWIGSIGERLNLTLTLDKVVSWGSQYDFGGVTYLCIMKTPEGCKVLYKGKSPHSLGLRTTYDAQDRCSTYDVGQEIVISAKIKEHSRSKYNNERETYISHPKVLEKAS